MNFWIFAVALLTVSAAVISWPFFTGSTRERMIGIWVLVMMPLAGLLLYQQIGTPEAVKLAAAAPQSQQSMQQPHDPQQPQMTEMVANLQQRMEENPDDPEGWIILGRSLKAMERYAEAVTALGNANRLAPGNALVMVELAEARLFTSGQPEISDEIRQLLQAAIEIDPQQQKGQWLLGMAAAQDGDDEQAVVIWQGLLEQLDPASGAAQGVTQQIEMANNRMGRSPSVPEPDKPVSADQGILITMTLDDELAQSLPQSSVLYVFIHPTGGAGMPLAVQRLASPAFPFTLTLSDDDMLRPGTSLTDFEQIDISARISMTGIANAASGDYQANRVTLDTKAVTAIALHLDQRVP